MSGGGYFVQFKPIKLDQPSHFTYRFSGLPRPERATVFFTIEDSRQWTDKEQYERLRGNNADNKVWEIEVASYEDLTGVLTMSLKDTQGNLVFEFEKMLKELRWSTGSNKRDSYGLYDEDTVFFKHDSREYILEVTINPDSILKNLEGYVLIEGGGFEPPSIGF